MHVKSSYFYWFIQCYEKEEKYVRQIVNSNIKIQTHNLSEHSNYNYFSSGFFCP